MLLRCLEVEGKGERSQGPLPVTKDNKQHSGRVVDEQLRDNQLRSKGKFVQGSVEQTNEAGKKGVSGEESVR